MAGTSLKINIDDQRGRLIPRVRGGMAPGRAWYSACMTLRTYLIWLGYFWPLIPGLLAALGASWMFLGTGAHVVRRCSAAVWRRCLLPVRMGADRHWRSWTGLNIFGHISQIPISLRPASSIACSR